MNLDSLVGNLVQYFIVFIVRQPFILLSLFLHYVKNATFEAFCHEAVYDYLHCYGTQTESYTHKEDV